LDEDVKPVLDPLNKKIIVKFSKNKQIKLRDYLNINGNILNSKVVYRENGKDSPLEETKVRFTERITQISQFVQTDEIKNIESLTFLKEENLLIGLSGSSIILLKINSGTNKFELIKNIKTDLLKNGQIQSVHALKDEKSNTVQLTVSLFQGGRAERIQHMVLDLGNYTVDREKLLKLQGGQKIIHFERKYKTNIITWN
jgi:hypothetical protein